MHHMSRLHMSRLDVSHSETLVILIQYSSNYRIHTTNNTPINSNNTTFVIACVYAIVVLPVFTCSC